MDIFSINKETYTNGKIIPNIDSILWVERYADPGEFTITGRPTEAFMEDLALGTLISHSDTTSVMMVENHSIDETKDGDIKIEITGRTIDAIAMESRMIANNGLTPVQVLQKYIDLPLFADYTTTYYNNRPSSWGQIEAIVNRYFLASRNINNDSFPFPNFYIRSTPSNRTNDPILYKYPLSAPKLGNVYEVVKNLLDATKSGMKIERPNQTHTTLDFVIHQGADLSSTVQFNWAAGDLENARYLWTNKDYKNAAYVTSDSFGLRVIPPLPTDITGWDLSFAAIDMGDVSQYYADPNALTTTEYNNLVSIYTTAALTELGKHKAGLFMDATVSKEARFEYGKHYDIGDIVYVVGNYGAETKMKVTEFARTMDSSGESGIPTLSPL